PNSKSKMVSESVIRLQLSGHSGHAPDVLDMRVGGC
ncbi:hypothetical protein A2U01_0061470, partial [Trifolium medium]|nr:hypothetical protein [Trifolium medium]